MNIAQVSDYLKKLQDTICDSFENEDEGASFSETNWKHGSGGGGKSRIIEAGKLIEKGGVNFSHVHGESLPFSASSSRANLADKKFQALGLSLVIHPDNPYVPTTHANLRMIVINEKGKSPFWWFGGGYDLTPYYGFDEDCKHWHEVAKRACSPFGEDVYPRYKKWCDEYFYIKHRNEARGIGGLFFDDLNQPDFKTCFKLVRSIGDSFLDAYLPIMRKRKIYTYTQKQKEFQMYRRGRYVEFNLLYDRGTIFGIQTGGRAESILMSLPPKVEWRYNWQPEKNTVESKLAENFLTPKEWIK